MIKVCRYLKSTGSWLKSIGSWLKSTGSCLKSTGSWVKSTFINENWWFLIHHIASKASSKHQCVREKEQAIPTDSSFFLSISHSAL